MMPRFVLSEYRLYLEGHYCRVESGSRKRTGRSFNDKAAKGIILQFQAESDDCVFVHDITYSWTLWTSGDTSESQKIICCSTIHPYLKADEREGNNVTNLPMLPNSKLGSRTRQTPSEGLIALS